MRFGLLMALAGAVTAWCHKERPCVFGPESWVMVRILACSGRFVHRLALDGMLDEASVHTPRADGTRKVNSYIGR